VSRPAEANASLSARPFVKKGSLTMRLDRRHLFSLLVVASFALLALASAAPPS
jgi:hypothetical protein